MNFMASAIGKLLFLKKLGPGLITGAADDDPSGIATYSQAGAQFGFATLWTMLFAYPLVVAIQALSARIGLVTGRGIAANLRDYYPIPLTSFLVISLVAANIVNIAADLAAMADVMELVLGGPSHLYAVGFGLLSVLLQIFVPYERYVRVLKWLTISLLAYGATVLIAHVPWREVLVDTLLPELELNPDYLAVVVGILGTTISPYLFFWQAGLEVEELGAEPLRAALRHIPEHARAELWRVKLDTGIGMAFSGITAFFIMLTAAATLHVYGIQDIQTSAQAAEALRPVAGEYAFALFSAGIVGTGMLAVPVLAGSAAYAVADALNWKSGMSFKAGEAKGYYAVLGVATLLGVILDFTEISPMKLLLWSAMINGVVAVPLMAAMVYLASQPEVMGRFTLTWRHKILSWTATAVMGLAVLALVFAQGKTYL